MKRLLLVLVLVSVGGCAGRIQGSPVFTQPTPTTWDYGFAAGALLGRVEQVNGVYNAYGCNGKNETGFTTLIEAEQYVVTSCANVNK